MTYLSRDEILAARQTFLKTEDVKVWGGVVRVRELTGTELDEYQQSMMQLTADGDMVPDAANMRAKLVTRAIIDEDGNRVFSELDIGTLGQQPGVGLNQLYEVAARLSGISGSSDDEATANLGEDLSDGSISTSPES